MCEFSQIICQVVKNSNGLNRSEIIQEFLKRGYNEVEISVTIEKTLTNLVKTGVITQIITQNSDKFIKDDFQTMHRDEEISFAC